MNQLGMVDGETGEPVGQEEFEEVTREMATSKSIQKVSKAIVRMAMIAGLESVVPVAEAAETCSAGNDSAATIWWLWFMIVILILMIIGLTAAMSWEVHVT